MTLANNETARVYDSLQRSIDWSEDNPAQQIEVMQVMKQLLIQAPSYTPIFEYGVNLLDGSKSVRTASEQCDYIIRRIQRMTRSS